MKLFSATLSLALGALVLPAQQAFAQWQQTSGPGGGFTTAILREGRHSFRGQFRAFTLTNTNPDAGTLYRSTDHAQTWTPANTGFVGVPNAFANSDTTLFVATSTDGIFKSRDDGLSWSALPNTKQLSPVRLLYANGVLYAGSVITGVYRVAR